MTGCYGWKVTKKAEEYKRRKEMENAETNLTNNQRQGDSGIRTAQEGRTKAFSG